MTLYAVHLSPVQSIYLFLGLVFSLQSNNCLPFPKKLYALTSAADQYSTDTLYHNALLCIPLSKFVAVYSTKR